MKSSFKLFTVGGIEIGIHYTWLFAFALITWSLSTGTYPEMFGRWTDAQYWIAGVLTALVLFVSVLVHELAHSFTAVRKGLPVKGITLFIFGGVSNIGEEAKKPWDEFLIAIVGPLTSLAIGGALMGYYLATGPEVQSRASIIQGIVFITGFTNLTVGVFNLIPGFPLDGGRVLRAVIWGITGSISRATTIAANVGRLFGWGMIALGLYIALNGNPISGIWMALIGWFLASAAASSKQDQRATQQLRGVTVRDVMQPNPATVRPDEPLQQVIDEYFVRRGLRALPVISDGALVGIVSLKDVQKLGIAEASSATVASVMTLPPLQVIAASDSVEAALRLLAEKDVNQAIVIDGGRMIGLVSRDNVVRYMHFKRGPTGGAGN